MKKWQIFLLIASLTLSLISLGFTLFKIIPTVSFTGETYIGAIATFIGIGVTLIIATQIFNSIEMNNKIGKINKIEERLLDLSSTFDKKNFRASGRVFWVQGLTFSSSGRHIESFHSFLLAMSFLIRAEQVDDVKRCFRNLKAQSEAIIDRVEDEKQKKKID